MIDPLSSQFEVNDRGGEYYAKLHTMHTRINQLISEFNALAGDHATAAQGLLAETAYADRFKWDGSPAALANPAAGRASLQLGSSATRPASDFATYHQGSLAEEAHTDRFKWNGSADGLNAAVGRVSLGLGSAATQSVTQFATAAQGALAQTAIQPDDLNDFFISVNQPSSIDITYLDDGSVDAVVEVVSGVPRLTTYSYNDDGSVDTILIVSGGVARMESYSYNPDGSVSGYVATTGAQT